MNAPTLDLDTGLAAMLAAAQPGDHGVVADWIDDHLRLDDLAAALRAGLDDPRLPAERERTACSDFRYRRLDRLVMFTMAGYRVWQPYVAGQPKKESPTGMVVCLCTPPEAPGGVRLWERWFPSVIDEPALRRLWDDLGKDLPKWDE